VTDTVGSRVRVARHRAGFSQAAVAKASGLSRTSIVNIEADNQGLTLDTLVDVAQALGISPSSLVPRMQQHVEPDWKAIRRVLDNALLVLADVLDQIPDGLS